MILSTTISAEWRWQKSDWSCLKHKCKVKKIETAIVGNFFKILACGGKERDKKIALGSLKEVKGKFNLLKMGENFTGLNTVGKETKKRKGWRLRKWILSVMTQILKETECSGMWYTSEGKCHSLHDWRKNNKRSVLRCVCRLSKRYYAPAVL